MTSYRSCDDSILTRSVSKRSTATTQHHRMITIVAFKYVVVMQRDHETIGQPKLQ